MEFLLVRHGESLGNAQARMQGRQDSPLSDRGRDQARTLARWLGERRVTWDAAYCSPLRRAAETAEIVCAALGGPVLEPEPDLAELDAGGLQGMTREEMGARFPSFLTRDVSGLGDFGEYGGESYDDVQKRVARLRARLEERHRAAAQRVLCVAHGGILFQLVKSLICTPVPRVCILRYGNCTTTLVRMRDRRGSWLGEVAWHAPIELMGGEAVDGSATLFR